MVEAGTPRVVAITGASSGIGRATAIAFARHGWRVGLIARREDDLDAARRDVITQGGTAAIAPSDVADAQALERAAVQIEAALGPIDVWINDAGISFYGTFEAIPEEEFRRVTDVTYLGAVNGTRIALRRMKPRDHGTIVNVCSAIAYRAVPLQSPYSGAKYALRGFSEAVRSELSHDRSRVHLTMVHPPAANTPFFAHAGSVMPDGAPRPPPPVYQPEIVADAIYLAATSRRREVMVGGATVGFALANKIMPGVLDVFAGVFGEFAQKSRRADVLHDRDPTGRDPNGKAAHRRPAGVHGAFDDEALPASVQMWASRNRTPLLLGFGAAMLVALAGPRRHRVS
jgi:short-subunit dehydrogenase